MVAADPFGHQAMFGSMFGNMQQMMSGMMGNMHAQMVRHRTFEYNMIMALFAVPFQPSDSYSVVYSSYYMLN